MKFKWNKNKESLLLLLLGGLVLLVLAIPSGGRSVKGQETSEEEAVAVSAKVEESYEQQMEQRVKELLKNVEGVGTVDVMIVLKSSEEKVLRVDKSTSKTTTEEQDQSGGVRKVTGEELAENTILSGSGSGTPVVEKEISPEIEGIVISAAGGGNPTVKSEISAAMEALFHIPPHKIKVLKRVD